MLRWFTIFLLAACASAAGCGMTGESTMEAMKRRAQARADAAKEEEEQAKQRVAKAAAAYAAAKGQAPSEDEADSAVVPMPIAKVPSKAVAKAGSPASDEATAAAPKAKQPAVRPPVPVQPETPLTDVQRRNKSAANLEQIIKALNQHARDHGTYPTQAITSKRFGRPLLSWRVAILPELGYAGFFQEFKLEEPWDSPHNLALARHIPEVFASPERGDEKTNYLAPHGPGTAWHGIRGKDPLSFADGADTTLVVIEADESAAVVWTKPEDLPTDQSLKPRLGTLRSEGFLAAFGNGYVVLIHNKVTDGQLSWMLSTDGDDYVTDRSIIFDATVPDVALVTSEPKPGEGEPGDAAKPADAKPAAGSAVASTPDRIRGLPPVRLPTPPPKPIRSAVPPEDEQEKAREQLREIFYAEYKASKSKADLDKLTARMLAEAPRLANDTAAQHELLKMVRELAVQTGDVKTALKAVELLETKFELAPLALRLATLDELSAGKGGSQTVLAAEAEKVFVAAFAQDEFAIALEAHRISMGMLRQGSDRGRIGRMSIYRGMILEAEKAHQLVPAALSALATNPENTQANDVAGRFFCLIKSEWEIGLPMMARGSDLKLRILARMDLEKERSGPETVQLADQYFQLAQEYKQPQRRCLELRAAFHYAAARAYLIPGVDLVKAEKRIEEIHKAYASDLLAKPAEAALPAAAPDPKDDSG